MPVPDHATPVDPSVLARIVKAYDVRGLVGEELDASLVRDLGIAAAAELVPDGGRMVVGHDMRPSSPELAAAFVDGVTRAGVEVVELGLASTDAVYFASGVFDAAGAVFTASHNPAAYNGIKLCRPGAAPVAIDTGLGRIRDRVLHGDLPTAPRPADRRREDVTARFAAHVRSFIDVDALAPVEVAVDAGNGMAGLIWPAVTEGLPITTTPLYFELDGSFPNHPANPLEPDNLRDLQAAVRSGGQAVGFAFDGDADRVFAVDETGRPVASSLVGAVVADRLLAHHPGETVLYNLICSRSVPETVRAAGGTAVRTRVGHSYIKQRMAATGAIYAVEHSGHFYFRDNYRADSGVIAALVLLEALEGRPLSEAVAPYDRYVASGELNFEVQDASAVTEAVAAAFAERGTADHEDGLTVVTDTGWFNLRPSNTEPFLRLNVEGDDDAAMQRLRDEVATLIGA